MIRKKMGGSSSKSNMVTISIKIDHLSHQYTLSDSLTMEDLINLVNEYRVQPIHDLMNPTTRTRMNKNITIKELIKFTSSLEAVI